MNRLIFIPLLLWGLLIGSSLRAAEEIRIHQLPGDSSIILSINSWLQSAFELQESTDLKNWSTVRMPVRGNGAELSFIQALSGNKFYRFRTYEIWAPGTLVVEDFEMLFGFFEVFTKREFTPVDEFKINFNVELTDFEAGLSVGQIGYFVYDLSDADLNQAVLMMIWETITATNLETDETVTFTPLEFTMLSEEIIPLELEIFVVFTGPNMGTTRTVTRYTDGSEETEYSAFPDESEVSLP